MKQTFLAALCVALSWLTVQAQADTVHFDDNIPVNWTATATSVLSLSTDHLKGGTHSLKWAAAAGDTLQALSLGIGTDIGSSSHFYIYSPAAGQDTLIVQFLDNSNTVQREGHVLLNFSGWREYHRNLLTDYNYGGTLSRFNLQGARIIYRPATPGASGSIWLDEVMFAGYGEARTPGPHMLLDHQHFAINPEDGPAGNPLESWLIQPDITATSATPAELSGLDTVRAAWLRSPGTAFSLLSAAKSYVTGCNITRNADNSIKGRPQPYVTIYHLDTLKLLSQYCGVLASAWLINSDAVAKSQLLLFTEYLLDQGLAEGGRNVIMMSDYPEIDTFATGFLQALPVYSTAMRRDVIRMLRWSHEYNKIYQPTVTPGLNEDYLYKKTPYLYELAAADDANDSAVRDLKCLSRWLEQNTLTGQGGRDGVKPDGTAFHHNAHQVTYLHAFISWINCAYNVRNTPFHISQTAYTNISKVVKTLYLETSKGAIFGNSDCGRNPFPTSIPLVDSNLRKLVAAGGALSAVPADTAMAAFYNYIYNTNYYPMPAADLDGYYAFNYAQLGVFRKNGWTVAMRGFTDRLFGAEIFPTENRYGRYQSYGAVEPLYLGQLTNTGYTNDGAGWDWNAPPGATTVRLPFASLQAIPSKMEEHQLGSFAGALSLGKNGIFGMDFRQDTVSGNYTTNNLRFHKSVFAFDTILVCLGSGINASSGGNEVVTNLYQSLINDSVNLDNITTKTTSSSRLKVDSPDHWVVNTPKTGYYVPKGNDSLVIVQGLQTTPRQSDLTGDSTSTAKASKAWLTHGSNPTDAKYHFVIVPNITPAKMKDLSAILAQNNVYKVLSQTDTLHAVRYFSSNLNAYVFFQAKSNVNIGFVKSISGKALLGAKENGDTLTLTIANPDLTAVSDSISYWRSTASTVSLTVKGSWNVLENATNATVVSTGDSLTATFTLQDGFPAALKLVNPAANPSAPGVWTNQYPVDSSWVYNIGKGSLNKDSLVGTGKIGFSPTTAGVGNSNGFLSDPPSGAVRVSSGSGTPRFDITGSPAKLKITASDTSTAQKFAAFGIAHATPVASAFFTFTLNNSPSTDTAEWSFAIGKNGSGTPYFSGNSGLPTQDNTSNFPDIFGGLKWSIRGSIVTFQCREKTTKTNYQPLSTTFFNRDSTYAMEIYANASSRQQTYIRGITTYLVLPRTYHVWANNTQMSYKGVAGFPADEMVADSLLLAFMVEGKNSGSISGGIVTRNNSATLTLAHTLQLNYAQANGPLGLATMAKTLTATPMTLTPVTVTPDLRLMPNPAHDYIQLLYTASRTGKTMITIVSMSGKVVLRKEVTLAAGENYIPVRISSLSPGVYSVNGILLLKN
jgi:hypothetical protein